MTPAPQPHDPEEFDPALNNPAVQLTAQASPAQPTRARRILRQLSTFLLGQGAVQALNVLTGLFLVRFLSTEAYAQFGLATAFQSVFSVLMDLGFAGTIIPLVGQRHQDHAVIGRYVRAARFLRNRTFLLLAPVAAAGFLFLVHHRHWPLDLQLLLLASILLSLYSGGTVSFFSAPLLLAGRLRDYYFPQILANAARLLANLLLLAAGTLNAWTAAALGALNVTVNGLLIRRNGRRHLQWPIHDDPAAQSELLRYVRPATPAILFAAFQQQISLFLISLFGSTLAIAQVAALSRIGQLFVVLSAVNLILVEPQIARLPRHRLLSRFLLYPALTAAALTPLVLLAFLWPAPYLLLLGPRFQALAGPMGLYVLSCAMNFVSGLLWIMNRARKWVFWSGSLIEVVLVLLTQTVFLALSGVRTLHQAVLFNLATSLCYAVAHLYVTLKGFRQNEQGQPHEAGLLRKSASRQP